MLKKLIIICVILLYSLPLYSIPYIIHVDARLYKPDVNAYYNILSKHFTTLKLREIIAVTLEICEIKSLDPALVLAIIWKESSFNHNALNSKDVGLMQVNTAVHSKLLRSKHLTFTDMFDIYNNIDVGTDIMLEIQSRGNRYEMHGNLYKYSPNECLDEFLSFSYYGQNKAKWKKQDYHNKILKYKKLMI